MKCLDKEPQRRYASAAAMADDLERWLRREPIEARPVGVWSRCRKWICRNPVVSGLTALFVVTALLGFAGILWQLSEKEQARQRAVAAEASQRGETARSRAVAEFLKSVLAAAQPSIALGRDTTLLRETLDRANHRILTELKDQPSIASELLNVVAESYMHLGEFVKAEAVAREGHRLMQLVAPGDHPVTAVALGILGSVLVERDQIPSALTFAADALAMNKRLYGTNHINVALALDSFAQATRAKGDLSRAEALTRESLAMLRALSGNSNLAVARGLTHLGGILRDRRMTVSAIKTLKEGLALHKAILPKDHPEVATALNELGMGLAAGGDLPQALTSHQEALELFTNTCGPDHPSTGWTLHYVADTLMCLGDVAQAEPLIERAVTIARKAYGPEHRHLGKFLAQAANSFLRVDRIDKAQPLLRESLIIIRKALKPEHEQVGATLDTLGRLLRRQLAWFQLGDLYAEDLPHARVRYAKKVEHLEYHLRMLCDALYSQGRFVEAEPVYREVIASFKRRLPDNSDTRMRAETLFARYLSEWAWSDHARGVRSDAQTNQLAARTREAEDLVRAVIAVCFAKPESDTARPITLANARSVLGMALVTVAVTHASTPLPERQSKLREAEETLTAALASQESNRYTYPEALRDTLTALVRLSQVWKVVWPTGPEHAKAPEWLAKLAVFEGKPSISISKPSLPPRPIELSTNCIDLTAFYTAGLDEEWRRKPWWRTNLGTLKKGSLEALLGAPRTLSGIEFDLRGIVQIDSREINRAAPGYPQGVLDIPLGRACRRMHFLHAYSWADEPGTCIASYRINYADGQQLYLPLLAGEDIGDWQFLGKDPGKGLKRAPIVWTGKNARGFGVRLYLRTWENPRPEIPLKSFDFLSSMTDAAAFLVSVTLEP